MNRIGSPAAISASILLAAALTSAARDPLFRDASAESGLDFVHVNGMAGDFHLVENMGSGCALLDFDNDGDLDLYLVQGRPLDRTVSGPEGDRLYRNDLGPGGVRFRPAAAPPPTSGYGMGVATGDFDDDGRVDLYVTAWGANRLLRNRGDGTFQDVTASSGTQDLGWSVPAVFFDFDRDGRLDLYVGNYVEYALDGARPCTSVTGARDYCNPAAYPAQPDRLFRNRGGGAFEDVTRRAGLDQAFGRALGVVAADFDDNGWPDLYVANDGTPNQLWLNQGDGTFREEGLLSGSAVNELGLSEASMGLEAADFDADGDLDLFVSHLTGETNTLYRNEGAAAFLDVSQRAGLGTPSQWATGFGTAALDYDNDGWLDLLVVNGAVRTLEKLARLRDPYPFHQPNQLFRNLGQGRFQEVSSEAGPALSLSEVSRGAACGDVDNDGDTDLVVANNNGPARLLLNQAGQSASWLGLRLLTGKRDALGARVRLERSGGRRLLRRVHSDGSYAAAGDPRVLFGLGEDRRAGPVRVEWPDGSLEEWTGLPAGRYTTLRQGEGKRP